MTLNTNLEALFDGIKQQAPPPVIAKAVAIFERLETAHVGENAPRSGDSAPDVALTSLDNEILPLRSLLHKGALVLIFYRGRWCPGCGSRP